MPALTRYIETCFNNGKAAVLLWYDANADFMAATVSYYAIFAVAPLLLLTLLLSDLVFGREYVAQLFTEWGTILGTDLVTLLGSAVTNLESLSQNFTLPLIGAIFFSGMTVGMFNAFISGVHLLWGVPPQGIKGWVKKCLHSALFIITLEAYLLVVVGVLKLANTLSFSFGTALGDLVSFTGVLLLTVLLFFLMFSLLPFRRPPFSARLAGATVAGILFTTTKSLVASYISLTPVPGIFGAAGLLIILLTWVYVSVAIIYYGAAITRVIEQNRYVNS